MREIYPLIRQRLPSVTFYIVGSNASPEIEAYDSATVRVMGYVPDINPLLQSARVFVAPLRFGAGVNGKIGEALSYGLPVVTTSIGAEGVGLTSGENAMIADDPAEFANSVLRVYEDMDLWRRLSESGYKHIENHFTPQIVGQKIEDGLKLLGVLGPIEPRTSFPARPLLVVLIESIPMPRIRWRGLLTSRLNPSRQTVCLHVVD